MPGIFIIVPKNLVSTIQNKVLPKHIRLIDVWKLTTEIHIISLYTFNRFKISDWTNESVVFWSNVIVALFLQSSLGRHFDRFIPNADATRSFTLQNFNYRLVRDYRRAAFNKQHILLHSPNGRRRTKNELNLV